MDTLLETIRLSNLAACFLQLLHLASQDRVDEVRVHEDVLWKHECLKRTLECVYC